MSSFTQFPPKILAELKRFLHWDKVSNFILHNLESCNLHNNTSWASPWMTRSQLPCRFFRRFCYCCGNGLYLCRELSFLFLFFFFLSHASFMLFNSLITFQNRALTSLFCFTYRQRFIFWFQGKVLVPAAKKDVPHMMSVDKDAPVLEANWLTAFELEKSSHHWQLPSENVT